MPPLGAGPVAVNSRFSLDIDGHDLGCFSTLEGLGVQVEVSEYMEGGNPAQPSVVYRALVDRDARSRFTVAGAIGHGHSGGENGIVDPDFSHMTTAMAILDRVVVEVRD